MKLSIFCAVCLCLLALGCQSVNQLDDSKRNPTTKLEILRDGAKPDRPYKEIGVITDNARLEEETAVEQKFISKAKKMGGDAVIIYPKIASGWERIPFGGIAASYVYKAAVVAYVPRGEAAEKPVTQKGAPALKPWKTGSGFFITDDGYFLTAAHVVAKATRLEVKTKAGALAAVLIKSDTANDITVLKVDAKTSAMPLVSSRTVKLGDPVFTIGFPNTELQGTEPKLTKGEISSLAGIHDDPRLFQISVAVQPGSSGGALITATGNVAGLVTSRLSEIAALKISGALPQNVNYAVKSSFISAFLETVPDLSAKLKEPFTAADRKSEDIIAEALDCSAMVIVH